MVKPGLLSWVEGLALLMVIICILTPRSVALGQFVTPDEHLWVTRSANFYFALGQRDFASTYQKPHPGVTIMWAGVASFLARYPQYRGSGLGQVDPNQFNYYISNREDITPLDILVTARVFIVLLHTALLTLSYLYAKRLAGRLPALIGILLVAFDPFHIGLNRIMHLDGLVGNLMFLSLLAFISFWQYRRRIDLLTSGMAAGLGWLTKSPALFTIPIIGIFVLLAAWKKVIPRRNYLDFRQIWPSLSPMIGWGMLGALTFTLFWPAMWVAPLQTLGSVIGKAGQLAEAGHLDALYFNGQVFDNGKLGFDFYPVAYLWRTTPVVLAGLLAGLVFFWRKRKPFDEPAARLLMLGLLIMAVFFTLGMTAAAKKFDRYLLPIFAPLDLAAGLGWAAVGYWLNERKQLNAIPRAGAILLVCLLGIQAYSALQTYPYYLSYYNPLLGGSRKAPAVMQIGWGEGIDQAARYLNQKPGAESLHVSSWYSAGSFSYFFNGHTRFIGYQSDLTQPEMENFLTSDYAVIYIHQWQRGIPKPILDYVSRLTPEHAIWINGLEYVRIYKIR